MFSASVRISQCIEQDLPFLATLDHPRYEITAIIAGESFSRRPCLPPEQQNLIVRSTDDGLVTQALA